MTVVRNAEKEAGDGSGTRLIAAYSAAVIGLEIILTIIMARVGPASSWATPLMLGIMWTPGLVALALQLAVRRTVRGFGWAPGPARFYAIAYLLPLAYGGLALVAAQLLGAGTIDFQRWATGAGRWGLPEHALYGMLIQMTLFMIPGLVTGIGEEIGWRGFLVPKLSERLGFWGIVNVSYVICLAFDLPGVFGGGYHGNGTPLPYALLCFAAVLSPGTVFLTALRL